MPAHESCIEFRYLKNRIIDLGDGSSFNIPYRMEPSEILGIATTVPKYDLTKVHTVKLLPEEADVPERESGESDRAHQELVDEAYATVRENRRRNKELRKRIDAYVTSGTIEIVKDSAKKSADAPKPAKAPKPATK